jgi:hypothetical protein
MYGAGIGGVFFIKDYSRPGPHTSLTVLVLAEWLFCIDFCCYLLSFPCALF